MIIKNNTNNSYEFGNHHMGSHRRYMVTFEKVKSGEAVIKTKQLSILINALNMGYLTIKLHGVLLDRFDAIKLISELYNDPSNFAFKYLKLKLENVDPAIDENHDGVISRKEILDANSDGTNNVQDLVAIINDNVQD